MANNPFGSWTPGFGNKSFFDIEDERRQAAAEAKASQDAADREAFGLGYRENHRQQAAYEQMVANQNAQLENSQKMQGSLGNSDVDRMILEAIKKQTGPQYENDLFTQGADQAAAASDARGAQLAEQMNRRGMSASDPSYTAATNQNFALQQQDTQRARLNASLGANTARQNATGQAIGYQSGLNGQRMQATNMTNQSLLKPVVAPPQVTVNGAGRATDAGMTAGANDAHATGTGYNIKPLDANNAYQQWLASQRKNA
jgi:hypothetical protein